MSEQLWHQSPRNEAHKEVFRTTRHICRQQTELREDILFYLELYSSGNVTGLGTLATPPADRLGEYVYRSRNGQTRFNLAAAMVDTAASLISQQPAVPQYLTRDGDLKLIRKAERCSQILQGQFDRKVQEECRRAQMFAYKAGTGFVHTYIDPETNLPTCTAVSPLEILVEHMDGFERKPRSMHRQRYLPKETMKAYYPRYAHAIESCGGVSKEGISGLVLQGASRDVWVYNDFVEVIESWHLSAGKQKGRHTICINNATLLDEEYKHRDFPFAVFRYRVRDYGFYGAGLVESCCDAQNRINDLITKNTRAQDIGSNLVVLNPNGPDAVHPEQITDELGLIINYDAVVGPPQVVKWEGTLGDLQQQIDLEYQRALLVEGLAESQVAGQGVGAGADSGVAKRAADDIQSRRLLSYINRFQDACIGVAQCIERTNDDLLASNPKYEISSEARTDRAVFLRSAKWADIRLEKGHARLSMMPMSALPTTPAAKWAALLEWIQGGFVSRPFAMSLLQFPDLDAYASIDLAHLDAAKWQIEQLLDGIMPEVDPRQDLNLAIDIATKSKLRAMTMGADEDELQLFEDYLVRCEDLLAMAQPEPAPAPMPGMPGAPAGPAGLMGGLPTQQVAPGLGVAGVAA